MLSSAGNCWEAFLAQHFWSRQLLHVLELIQETQQMLVSSLVNSAEIHCDFVIAGGVFCHPQRCSSQPRWGPGSARLWPWARRAAPRVPGMQQCHRHLQACAGPRPQVGLGVILHFQLLIKPMLGSTLWAHPGCVS